MSRLFSLFIITSLVLFCVTPAIQRQFIKRTCSENQTYHRCGSICQPYCNQQPDDIRECDSLCHPGCYCRIGFLKEAIDSSYCIAEGECKNLPKCRKGEIYKICEQLCPISCDNLDDNTCERRCIKGCVCKNGLIRSDNSPFGDCIPEYQCPVYSK